MEISYDAEILSIAQVLHWLFLFLEESNAWQTAGDRGI